MQELDLRRYQSGTAKLPGLLIDVELPELSFFRNDGIVENLEKHTEKVLAELHTGDNAKTVIESGDGPYGILKLGKHIGRVAELIEGRKIKFSVIYGADNGYPYNTLTLAHESTHAAIFLDNRTGIMKIQLLHDLYSHGFDINPFEKYRSNTAAGKKAAEEDICDLFGIFAAYKLEENKKEGEGEKYLHEISNRSRYTYNNIEQNHEKEAKIARDLLISGGMK